jgi:uncharacterized membrane protein
MPDRVKFRLRGREVSRVEAFSDVVFGFALTLIVVSLEVPTRYEELLQTMRGFPAFAICFAILTWVWHAHHTYFRRYALSDELTIALNTMLLFLVLFYIYPMKFLFSLVTFQIAQPGRGSATQLFLIYGLGFAGIFAVFVALYTHAWHQREELDLTPIERHDTITSITMYTSYIAIGLLSCALALFAPERVGLAGWTYFLIGPVSTVIGRKRGAERRRMEETMVGVGAA